MVISNIIMKSLLILIFVLSSISRGQLPQKGNLLNNKADTTIILQNNVVSLDSLIDKGGNVWIQIK